LHVSARRTDRRGPQTAQDARPSGDEFDQRSLVLKPIALRVVDTHVAQNFIILNEFGNRFLPMKWPISLIDFTTAWSFGLVFMSLTKMPSIFRKSTGRLLRCE
jgi:hypothetical protein